MECTERKYQLLFSRQGECHQHSHNQKVDYEKFSKLLEINFLIKLHAIRNIFEAA